MIAGDWVACCLLTIIFFMPFMLPSFLRETIGVTIIFFLMIIIRLSFVMYTHLISDTWMNDDALRLFWEAVNFEGVWYPAIGADLYMQFIAAIFYILGPSMMLVQAFSIFACALSFVLLLKINHVLNEGKHTMLILMLTFFPIMLVVMTSQPMREPFQMLGLMGISYCLVLWHARKQCSGVFFITSVIFLMLSHKMLFGFGAVIFALALLWNFDAKVGILNFYRTLWLIAFGLVFSVFISWSPEVPGLGTVKQVLSGDIVSAVNDYRSILLPGRASYDLFLDASSLTSLLKSLLFIIIYYFFMPFPSFVSTFSDLYAWFESLLRFLLLMCSFVALKHSEGGKRRALLMLLVIYILLNIFWSLGVGNYGTALRHFVMSSWILALIGAGELYMMLQFNLRILYGKKNNGQKTFSYL